MRGVEDKMKGAEDKKREGEYKERYNIDTVKQISKFLISEIFLFILRF